MTVARENLNVTSNDFRDSKLRTANIAGARKPEEEDFIEVEAVPERAEQEKPPLFSSELNQDFRTQWQNIQASFVDEPRASVERADELVAELMQRLAQSFSEQRSELEKQWEASKEISTEELRLALRRYRSFFERLLSI